MAQIDTSTTTYTGSTLRPFLNAEGIVKRFGEHRAIDDVSLAVGRGEVISVIGPSGAGKSTFLRCLNLLELPEEGSLAIGDEEIVFAEGRAPARAQVSRLRRQAGMVFQSFNLFPHLTAAQNIELAQKRVLGRSAEEAADRARTLLARVGLAAKADAYPSQCSGGQQQRIAIARALAMDPQLMLFDEPTSGLDPEVGAEILAVMRELADSGMTMLIATHEMEFARHVSNRVIVMVDGAIVEQGQPEQIMTEPKSERVGRFLSAVLGR
ncbi:amino acid ABC transporter ATP-binding protein [Leucobacter allii]|uniref:Amino acid ABC transporter ATP-binding protein n=1 Tax=Leucobacter allii TaxID=2932247 RepID=A0ABY4FJ03_9MICO|nr:amino acid ABC transporter ATP-binding protein [Leucobacter allii]UOQ55919.1 amino acid ABC transporter ATP-binding protein [Leucobacter allii]UOR00435.1 amino acid ABC transporter ATP-binding protein [Leucobacter allii]